LVVRLKSITANTWARHQHYEEADEYIYWLNQVGLPSKRLRELQKSEEGHQKTDGLLLPSVFCEQLLVIVA